MSDTELRPEDLRRELAELRQQVVVLQEQSLKTRNGQHNIVYINNIEQAVLVTHEARESMTAPHEVRQQPISALGYGIIAFIGLGITVVVGWYLLANVSTLAASGTIGQAYYVLLCVLGLAVAALLFGAMQSVASLRGRHLGVTYILGGPAAGFAIVVVGGFWLTKPNPLFDLTVRLVGDISAREAKGDDWVTVDIAQNHVRLPINSLGDAVHHSLSMELHTEPVRIKLDSQRLQVKEEKEYYSIPLDNVIRIDVVRMDKDLKKRAEMKGELQTILAKFIEGQIDNGEFIFHLLNEYIKNPTPQKWEITLEDIGKSLQPIHDAIDLSLRYDSTLAPLTEPISSQLQKTEKSLDEFRNYFTKTRGARVSGAHQEELIISHGKPPPTRLQARRWRDDLQYNYKKMSTYIRRLLSAIKDKT